MRGFGSGLVRLTAMLLALAAWSAIAIAQKPTPQERPVFRSGVDMIPVDVVVLDSDGKQVADLAPGAFAVTIDGRPRRIASLRYIASTKPAAAAMAPAAPGRAALSSPPVSSNQDAPGRFVMVVVDEAGMDFGGIRTAAEALPHLLDALGPRDRVGLAVLPHGGVVVPFTRDHARILDAARRPAGRSLLRQPVTSQNVGWAEALEHMRNPEGPGWMSVIERNCAYCGADKGCRLACIAENEAEAGSMAFDIRQRLQEFRGSLGGVLSYLAGIDAPKTVVLLSSGLIAEAADTDLAALGHDAAAADCSIYALHFNAWDLPDAAERAPSPSSLDDLQLRRTSLESLAGRTGGWVYQLVGSAERPFEKLATELAGYYLLGVEAERGDRDGKRHQIRVEVAKKGVSVRARREIAASKPAAALPSPADAVRALLRSPTTANEVQLRVVSYVEPAAESGKLRLLVSAEVGLETTAPDELTIGWALLGENGKAWGGGSETVTLKPLAGRARAPLSFARAAVVAAGRYLFKLAVIDREGRRGSVTHEIEAGLRSAGPLAVGDLILASPPADVKSDFEPPLDCVIEGDRLLLHLRVTAPQRETLKRARATIEIARGEEERALLHSALPLTARSENQRVLDVGVGLGLLPAGSYVARVRLLAGGETVATISRSFVFAPPPRAAGPGSEAGPRTTPLPAAPFTLAELLDPHALAPVLDRAARAAPDLPAQVFEHARAGRLGSAVGTLPPEAAGPVPAFLRGLAQLERADLEAARREFAESRRSDPEFLDAVLFIGICYAAGGRDDEATGAWQSARLGLNEEAMVHHLLIDARLRRGQVDHAKTLVEQAMKRWPEDARFQRQLASVLAADNRADDALVVLERYLAGHGNDTYALFLALQLLYETATRSTANASPALVQQFRSYAGMYDAAGGPERALVAEWQKYLTR